MKNILIVALSLVVVSCASNPDKIGAAYVSPLTYQNYDCQQIALEMSHIQRKTSELYGRLKKERKKDNWMMGIGMVLFWPTLFALSGGDGPEAAEFSQLKGQYEALRQVSIEKKCVNASMMSPEDIIKAADKMNANAPPNANPNTQAQTVSTSQMRSVSESQKENCNFIQTVTKGAGGREDISANTEAAMNSALEDAASVGADSYFVVNVDTTQQGSSVILEAYKCK